jgi:hypothetical protein
MTYGHPESRESVILKNQEEVNETFDEVNQDKSVIEKRKAEESIEDILSVKDQELILNQWKIR